MQKPCSIFHNNDSKKKVVRQIDSKVVFVITQHEESIYERPDIKSIYRRIVMLEKNRWFLSNTFTLENVTIEQWCRYIQYSELMDYITIHVDNKSIWIKSVTVMLLEKHITVLTKKNSTVLNRSSLHVAHVNMVHLECVFQK